MLKNKEFLQNMVYWCTILTCGIIYVLALGFFIIGGLMLLCGGGWLVQTWTVIVGAVISIIGTSYLITKYRYLEDDD